MGLYTAAYLRLFLTCRRRSLKIPSSITSTSHACAVCADFKKKPTLSDNLKLALNWKSKKAHFWLASLATCHSTLEVRLDSRVSSSLLLIVHCHLDVGTGPLSRPRCLEWRCFLVNFNKVSKCMLYLGYTMLLLVGKDFKLLYELKVYEISRISMDPKSL